MKPTRRPQRPSVGDILHRRAPLAPGILLQMSFRSWRATNFLDRGSRAPAYLGDNRARAALLAVRACCRTGDTVSIDHQGTVRQNQRADRFLTRS